MKMKSELFNELISSIRQAGKIYRRKNMNRHEMFKKRLNEIGAYDNDSDYDGMIGTAVEELSETFSKQGHSGMSAIIILGLFNQLMSEYNDPESKMWQDQALPEG